MQGLVPLASDLAAPQLEAFTARLAEALLIVSTQTVQPAEAVLSLDAFNLLKRSGDAFYKAAAIRLHELFLQEFHALRTGRNARNDDEQNLALVSFEEMEDRVAIAGVSQSIELQYAESLAALNVRIADLFERDEISGAQNPFRPAVFLQAIDQAWRAFSSAPESHRLVLRLLQPDMFIQLAPILTGLNEALIARGVVPKIAKAQRNKKAESGAARDTDNERRGQSMYQKLQRWLLTPITLGGDAAQADARSRAQTAALMRARHQDADGGMTIAPELLGYLSNLQKSAQRNTGHQASAAHGYATTTNLRRIASHAPPGALTPIDENTIELLAKIFDYLFAERHIPAEMKGLIGQLQVPLLKAALIDREFFFDARHPARRLIETMTTASALWDKDKGRDDPLYKAIEQVVDRVQQEFDANIESFTAALGDLESFIEEEEHITETAIATPIAEAMRQEMLQQAREAAECDIAARIETGEVAGFVEVFLERQWVRVLALAHTVAETKPDALQQALKTMDDLIWSVKPKTRAEDRKDLLKRLPAMLTLMNAWLNVVRWDDAERAQFFANLVERHAVIVREPLELSPRRQVEFAVNAAQKASERRFSQREQEMQETPVDEHAAMVEALKTGDWMDFVRHDGSSVKFKLAWISPHRSCFIFTDRQGRDSMSFTAEELARTFREQRAVLAPTSSVVDRALVAALEQIEID